ncbi:hypothetical protein PR048_003059 [Dryococelus australis]|uniref:Uncharacterized protein n=1 Tax=Dryococelus australis TaxID=614101 RepID=A0ABQ9IM17_9NEOP|nr:hypothetical protein PR048_003059 [Dryococelus australis]
MQERQVVRDRAAELRRQAIAPALVLVIDFPPCICTPVESPVQPRPNLPHLGETYPDCNTQEEGRSPFAYVRAQSQHITTVNEHITSSSSQHDRLSAGQHATSDYVACTDQNPRLYNETPREPQTLAGVASAAAPYYFLANANAEELLSCVGCDSIKPCSMRCRVKHSGLLCARAPTMWQCVPGESSLTGWRIPLTHDVFCTLEFAHSTCTLHPIFKHATHTEAGHYSSTQQRDAYLQGMLMPVKETTDMWPKILLFTKKLQEAFQPPEFLTEVILNVNVSSRGNRKLPLQTKNIQPLQREASHSLTLLKSLLAWKFSIKGPAQPGSRQSLHLFQLTKMKDSSRVVCSFTALLVPLESSAAARSITSCAGALYCHPGIPDIPEAQTPSQVTSTPSRGSPEPTPEEVVKHVTTAFPSETPILTTALLVRDTRKSHLDTKLRITKSETVDHVRDVKVNLPNSVELNSPLPTVWKILRKRLRVKPYKLQLLQATSHNDKLLRLQFCIDIQNHLEDDDFRN